MKKTKKQSGITLIALIITIIVLLILAGITIGQLMGENGILKNAQLAAEKHKIEEGKERIELLLTENVIDRITSKEKLTVDKIIGALEGEEGIKSVGQKDENKVTVETEEGYIYDVIINEEGKIEIEYIEKEEGTTGGEIEGGEVTPTDTEGPVVEIEAQDITTNSVKLLVTASDEGSGLAETKTYQYYLGDELKEESETNTYTFSSLSKGTPYTLKVVVKDKLGNSTTKSIDITTVTPIGTAAEVLKEGNYLKYLDGTGKERVCVVLYGPENANYSSYGIQIITMEVVEQIEFGYGPGYGGETVEEINASKESYNQAITTLNSRAEVYRNKNLSSSARSVGTVPNNPNSESSYYYNSSYSWFSSWSGKFLDGDTNYVKDIEQMTVLNIGDIGGRGLYWLGSRRVYSDELWGDTRIHFGLYTAWGSTTESIVWDFSVASIESSGINFAGTDTSGLRPVFTLNSDTNIIKGEGTSLSPYELEI